MGMDAESGRSRREKDALREDGEALLTVTDLAVGHEGQPVLSGLNFTVRAGDFWCVLGENGSGKTTLMRTLLGLCPPIGGSISFGEGLKSGEIGYLPQQTEAQKDFPASVREIVLSGFRGSMGLRPFYSQGERQRALESLARMGIADLGGRSFRELSGGQKQRVLLARALCAARRLLLLDEPLTGLDAVASAHMHDLLKGLNEEGVAIIMISHSIADSLRLASHILFIGGAFFCGSRNGFAASEAGRFLSGLESGMKAEGR